jgi:WXG100 family type VII secretion target
MSGPGSIFYGYDDIHSHGATLKGQAGSLEAEYHAIINDVNAAAAFWGGTGSTAFQQFVTELNRNFAQIFAELHSHGATVQTVGQNMRDLDASIGSSWMV